MITARHSLIVHRNEEGLPGHESSGQTLDGGSFLRQVIS